jgi:hypothetical protein
MATKTGTLTVTGEDPRVAASPVFANFVAVSQVGTEVQFEFIFLDLAQLAQKFDRVKVGDDVPDSDMQGKTVGKIIVPVSSFLQLKEHLLSLFQKLEVTADESRPKETGTEREYGD